MKLGILPLTESNCAQGCSTKYFQQGVKMNESTVLPKGMQSYACAIHGPITFPGNKHTGYKLGLDAFVKKLISTEEIQRLRWIRQNGLSHFVFNTMEHSRFTHSLGVAFVARRMIDRISLNSGIKDTEKIWDWKYETVAAALLHDIGHGPFSHSLEEILNAINPNQQFKHEEMTLRMIQEKTEVHKVLKDCHKDLPNQVAEFFVENRKKDHWRYRIVSSQLDADRLDYILRDAQMAGLKGVGFDLDRILQHLYVGDYLKDHYFVLDRKAIESLESALLANDQLYRAVYFHRKVRAATAMLQTLLLRAASLVKDEILKGTDDKIILRLFKYKNHPLLELIKNVLRGEKVNLKAYLKLTENHIWALIELWREDPDKILKDYAHRLWSRDLHCAEEFHGHDEGVKKEKKALQKLMDEKYLRLSKDDLDQYYVLSDTSRRKSYKEGDSIYLGDQKDPVKKPISLEFEQSSRIIRMLVEPHTLEYIVYPRSTDKSQSDQSSALPSEKVVIDPVAQEPELALSNGQIPKPAEVFEPPVNVWPS
jgi:uncharacterized protein